MQMVMFVLDDPEKLDDVLDTWDAIGVSGVTIIESTGLNRRRLARRVGSTLMAGFNRLVETGYEGHYTLFTVVKGEEFVKACITAVEAVVGDLDLPNTGVLASWPIAKVKGIPARQLHDEGNDDMG